MISLNGRKAAAMDGFTGPQRLFIGWAQVWRMKYRNAALSTAPLKKGNSL
jgi:endothelin-converting enzyme/putative endopeptidase